MEVNGLSFHSVESGSEHSSVVVLLGGWPQTWYAWRHVIPLLSNVHHVIALELKGQGESSLGLGSDYSIESVSHELEAYFIERKFKKLMWYYFIKAIPNYWAHQKGAKRVP